MEGHINASPEVQREARLRRTVTVMQVDVGTARAAQALRGAGVQPILLRGPSIAQWLYRNRDARIYGDTDFLVDPAQLKDAGEALAELGYLPGDRGRRGLGPARGWSTHDGKGVDLNTTIFGAGVSDATLWRVLRTRVEPITVANVELSCLAPAARALHIATRRAGFQEPEGYPIEDLRRALHWLPEPLWRDAARLARDLEAEPAFATGLRLGGADQLVDALDVDELRGPDLRTLIEGPDWTVLGVDAIRGASGARQKLTALATALVPPAQQVRWSDVRANRGRPELVVAYARRAGRIARSLPGELRGEPRPMRSERPGHPDQELR